MKKIIIGLTLLAALFICTLLNVKYIDSLITELSETVESSRMSAESGDFAAAEDLLKQAIDRWEGADSYTRIVIHHSDMDTMSGAFYDLLSDIKSQDGNQATGAYEKVLRHLQTMSSMERISLGSVF